uniref:Uncharacterized protein n=1 Tax=Meloidogyne enterolobii TaxID=390850 RepID=A0A6V7Y7X6_MELEN|nr:unnamed protein product [Meloidogyne enterolobii]
MDDNICYSLQLMVVPTQSMVMAPGGGFFSVQRVKYPVQTFFFFNEMGGSSLNEISTRTPVMAMPFTWTSRPLSRDTSFITFGR